MKWILALFLALAFLMGCDGQTDREEVRVIYFTGFPNDALNATFPQLQIALHSPYEISIEWQINTQPTFLRYAESPQNVTCEFGEEANGEDQSIRVNGLKSNTTYNFVLCERNSDLSQWFEFKTPTYEFLSFQDWCEYPHASDSLKTTFRLLMSAVGAGNCEVLMRRTDVVSVEIDSQEKLDLYPISAFQNTLQTLTLKRTQLQNTESLQNLKKLQNLSFDKVQFPLDRSLPDLSFLKSMPSLQSLRLNQIPNAIVIQNELENLRQLKTLSLHSLSTVQIAETAFSGLPLSQLSIQNGFLSTLNLISQLTELKQLDLISSRVSSTDALQNLTQLEQLNLSDNDLTVVPTELQDLPLQVLSLSFNPISDASPLASRTTLRILDISHTQISDISMLSSLTAIEELNYFASLAWGIAPCPFADTTICEYPRSSQ